MPILQRVPKYRIVSLIKAGNEERERNRKPDKERRVIRVIPAVVITSLIISTLPVASTSPSVSVVAVAAAIIAAVIIPVIIAVAAGMTGMGSAGSR